MFRTVLSSFVGVAFVTALATPGLAEDQLPTLKTGRGQVITGSVRTYVATPKEAFSTPHATISPYLYLNRCSGDCMITGGGVNDARTNTSTIPPAGQHVISEFATFEGATGAEADAEWAAVVQCMKEVYSPYNVTVTDQKPEGVSYTMAIIAGKASQIGLGPGILGIAPLAGDCSPQDNVISFSFANDHAAFDRVNNLCWTAAQETAHAFGLDHEFKFNDGTSACNDPMTYRTDCGGQKFFRNKPAECGEMSSRQCRCGGTQNSHNKIRAVFGDAVTIVPPPTVEITTPMAGAKITNSSAVGISAGSQRGVNSVDLWLNGYKWAEVPGAKFLNLGQPNPSKYTIPLPQGVPDGVIDIVVKAVDDLGGDTGETDSETITVTKGEPCTSADTCAKGQVCESGKCFWEPPVGELGDTCEFSQFCKTGICTDTSEGAFCSQDCVVGVADSCPMDFECIPTGGQNGQCITTSSGGGCCSVSTGNQAVIHFGISALVLGLVIRRRRKR
jgi:hypothetical protein